MTTYRFRSPSIRRLIHIFDGAAAGAYTLPPRVEEVRAAIERLAAEDARHRGLPDPLAGLDLVGELVAAARTDGHYPEAKRLVQAEAERRSRDAYSVALAAAAEQLEDQLDTALTGTAEELVVSHLRPALDQLLADAAQVAALLRPFGLDPGGLLAAPADARRARGDLDRLAARYQAIRNAAAAIGGRMPPPGPYRVAAGELCNAAELAVGYRPGVVPWPADVAARLCWFVEHDAEPWLPTPADIDAHVAAQAEAAKAPDPGPVTVVDPERVPA